MKCHLTSGDIKRIACWIPAMCQTGKIGVNTTQSLPPKAASQEMETHLRDDGGVWGWFSRGGPRVRFLTRYDGEVSEPLMGRQGSRVSMRVARGSASFLSSHGWGTCPRDVLKKVSRGLSCVEAGNPGFPQLVQVTSGGFSWWL